MIKRIINFLKRKYLIKNYKLDKIIEEQENKYSNLNLNRETGLEILKKHKEKYNFLERPMSSEHEVIFSSISNSNKHIKNILEIGTFDGNNCFLLSLLFPNSIIKTIDLPEKDDDFIKFYNRENIVEKFIEKRNKIIEKRKNINFENLNSLNLINKEDKYDLIWIDGAHGYPHVCIDIINSLKLISENGIIMCDDVFEKRHSNEDKMYNSIASYETLKSLEKENLIKLNLFYKRLKAINNYDKKKIKYIAVFQKN